MVALETIWTAPDLMRADIAYSSAPFAGGPLPPGFQGPKALSFLSNYTASPPVQWIWQELEGKIYCNKGGVGPGGADICIGANLQYNSTRVYGGKPVYSWVGYEPSDARNGQRDCWHELQINSVESTDPARWLGALSQCTSRPAPGQGYPQASVQSIQMFDFSTAPFPPGTFDLPAECVE